MKKMKLIEKHIALNSDVSPQWIYALCPDQTGWFKAYCNKKGLRPQFSIEIPVDLFEALLLMERCQALGANRISSNEFKELNFYNALSLQVFQIGF